MPLTQVSMSATIVGSRTDSMNIRWNPADSTPSNLDRVGRWHGCTTRDPDRSIRVAVLVADMFHVGRPPRLDQGERIGHFMKLVSSHAEGRTPQIVSQGLDDERLLLHLDVKDIKSAPRLGRARAAFRDLSGVPGQPRVESASQRNGCEDGRIVVARPANTTSAPSSRARWNGSTPITATMRVLLLRNLSVVRRCRINGMNPPIGQTLDDDFGLDLRVNLRHREAQVVLRSNRPSQVREVVDAPITTRPSAQDPTSRGTLARRRPRP